MRELTPGAVKCFKWKMMALISYAGQPGSSGGRGLGAEPFYEMAVMDVFMMKSRNFSGLK